MTQKRSVSRGGQMTKKVLERALEMAAGFMA